MESKNLLFGGFSLFYWTPPLALTDSILKLPEDVADIDFLDKDSPQMCAKYVPNMYTYHQLLEKETADTTDFLKVYF